MLAELILSSLSKAFVVVTNPLVRAATRLPNVERPAPEMLLCGYSVAICQVTCPLTWAKDGVAQTIQHETSAPRMRTTRIVTAREEGNSPLNMLFPPETCDAGR